MRVALISSDTSPQSGAARCLLRLALGLTQQGHEPILLVSELTGIALDAARAGIEVHRTHAHRPRLRHGWRGVAQWFINFPPSVILLACQLRRLRVNIVHANEFIELQAGIAARLAGLPCIYHVRWPFGTSLPERMVAVFVAMMSRGLIFVSRSTQDLFSRAAGGTAARPIWVIDDPGPEIMQAPPDVRDDVRREFGLPAESLIVLDVSKLIPHKGQDIFLQAAGQVATAALQVRFLVVGGEVPGHEGYARHLCNLASRGPLRRKVILTGNRNDVPRLMAAADVVVHAATYPEPFPGVVLEAMATGKAVIASRIGGIPEQISDGLTGVLVEPARVEELAQAMLLLLGDAHLLARLGSAAQREYARRYSIERHAAAVAAAYAHVLRTPG